MSNNPFQRSGLASLSDLQTPEWHCLFSLLEKDQADFLSHESEFRSADYKWPRDALHNWSRIWEYPYVYFHLQQALEQRWRGVAAPQVVDLGSGVTFFPFSVARLGYQVICTDIDPVCERDIARIPGVFSPAPGTVRFRLAHGDSLPFADGEVSAVYCISVLEHIAHFERTIEEMSRILTPGGIALLTIDLDLRGDNQIGVREYQRLMISLETHFSFLHADRTIHPADLLTSVSSPYRVLPVRGFRSLPFFVKERIIRPLLGRQPRPALPFLLAVQGFALQKK